MFLNHPMQIPFRLHDLLVVWNMFYFFHILGIMIPADELIFFRGVAKNHQPDEQVRHSSIHQFHNKQCETLQCFHAGPLGLSKVNLRLTMRCRQTCFLGIIFVAIGLSGFSLCWHQPGHTVGNWNALFSISK